MKSYLKKRISLTPKDQRWFWTREWQKKEREADADIARGRVKEFPSAEDLLEDLRAQLGLPASIKL